MSYVIYARKSTESEDRQVMSIDSQISELQTIAARLNVPVVRVLRESHSAKAPGRPVFTELMRAVHKGNVRGILAWKMDRLARNHMDTGMILQALADRQLEKVITVDRTYTSSGNDRFIGNFELGMATKYIDDLRQNVNRGIRAKYQQGWVTHAPPIGYLKNRDDKTIVKDPERFDLIRRIWELALSGTLRPDVIRDIANKEWGLRTRKTKHGGGGDLQRSTIYALLRNPFYMGVIRLRSTGEIFAGAHPAMVSREEFAHVQDILGGANRPRPYKHEFALTGLLTCGHCGAAITAEQHVKPNGKTYVYYHCTYQKAGTPCREPRVSAVDLENQVLSVLERIHIPGRILALLLTQARQEQQAEHARREQIHRTLEQALESYRGQEGTLLDLRLRSRLTDDMYDQKHKELEERRQSVSEKLAHLNGSIEEIQAQITATFFFASKAAETFRNGTRVQRRAILRAVSSNCTLRASKVALTLNKPFSILADSNGLFNHSG